MANDCAIPLSSLGTPLACACEKDAKALELIEEMTKNVDTIQEKVLAEILSQNANTEYLQRFNLDGATDRDSFKSKVPVVTYEDIKPDILRVANGDKSPIFSSQPISEFFLTSGTSGGEHKLIPAIHEDSFRTQMLAGLLMPIMNVYVPGLDKGKGLYFRFTRDDSMTPGGIPARSVLCSNIKSSYFHNRPYDPYQDYTSPTETILCVDYFQSMYSQMLCGLVMREEVLRMGAIFASSLLQAIQFLRLNWKELSHDIRTGTLNPKVTDPSVRQCLSKILKSDLKLAQFITEECEGGNWERIIPRIWPHTKYLEVIVTGSMAQYIPTLDYYSGGLPLASVAYGSSECNFGVNLNPLCKPSEVSYTIMPNLGYFEFIPQDPNNPYPFSRESPPKLVDLANVEEGKEYEIVVTTYAGLCRYRIGDILQVTGFHNAVAPQFKYVKRMNVVLSIDCDKTTEEELREAIGNASVLLQPYNMVVVEYTSYADVKTIPGHYVIYWELLVKDTASKQMLPKDVLNECCLAIEESLGEMYRRLRVTGNLIGPLEIRVVKNGTFEELMNYAISRGASINQYKVPRCVSFTPIVELLESRVVSRHFSPAPPSWIPTF